MKLVAGTLLALGLLLAASGCRTAEVNSIAHNRPPVRLVRPTFDLDEFVAEHNENASRIQNIKATPSITATLSPPGEKPTEAQVNGRLALERPRNFKLEIGYHLHDIADIGSNDEKFWFWFQNKNDPSVYYCNYEDRSSTSLAITYQPDWIIDAMGLNVISQEEVSRIQVQAGAQAGTTILTFPPRRDSGLPYTRIMIVSDQTRQVQLLKVLAEDGKTLIAQATVKKYDKYPTGPTRRGSRSAPPPAVETCTLPSNMTLEWKRERILLDVLLAGVELNKLEPQQSTAIFVEPTPRGSTRVNLAQLARPEQSQQTATDVRESMPIPEPRKRASRAPAQPVQEDSATSRTSATRLEKSPTPPVGGVVLLPVLDLDVVEAPRPGPSTRTGDPVPETALIPPPSTARE
ncbi:hypothetical protein [Aquisphaera insulae]|uniref:hypothetical protein n=1 Tax=Aquisphaera insulae TaxID=2712864 RepID=UPI0013EA3339|nr:hypothetical protein [Aquisphaera insulae]